MKIIGNLSDFGVVEVANKTIEFSIVNKFGNLSYSLIHPTQKLSSSSSISIESDNQGNFEAQVEPTTRLVGDAYLKINIPSIGKYKLIKFANTMSGTMYSHCLLNQIDYESMADITTNVVGELELRFTKSFAQKFEDSILYKQHYLSHEEEKMAQKYIAQADFDESTRCPDVLQLDKFLGGL